MKTKLFYDETTIDIWKNILTEKRNMNYAFGKSIINNASLFQNIETVLDAGCGWGGSISRIKSINPAIKATGLTESSQQAEYIGNKFDVIVANANEYKVQSQYDMVTFIQSITHMKDIAFSNLTKTTNKVFINDFVSPAKETSHISEKWVMKIRSISDWERLLKEEFEIKKFDILPLQEYVEDSLFWLNNINKHKYNGITWQVTVLENLCKSFITRSKNFTHKEHLPPYLPDTFLVDIYAERKCGCSSVVER